MTSARKFRKPRRLYAVEVQSTHTGVVAPYISRYFTRIESARKWAKFCAKYGPARILIDGIRGQEVR